jgi:hypothetical protein
MLVKNLLVGELMLERNKILWPLAAGLAGMALLTAVYIGIVSLAMGFDYAKFLFWDDRFIVIPIIVGFGIQSALYITLKKRLFVPVTSVGPSGAVTGTSGTVSTAAMVACCAHHLTDVLPILGLTAAATFLAEYRIPFMIVGLASNVIGIAIMLFILFRERRRAIDSLALAASAA